MASLRTVPERYWDLSATHSDSSVLTVPGKILGPMLERLQVHGITLDFAPRMTRTETPYGTVYQADDNPTSTRVWENKPMADFNFVRSGSTGPTYHTISSNTKTLTGITRQDHYLSLLTDYELLVCVIKLPNESCVGAYTFSCDGVIWYRVYVNVIECFRKLFVQLSLQGKALKLPVLPIYGLSQYSKVRVKHSRYPLKPVVDRILSTIMRNVNVCKLSFPQVLVPPEDIEYVIFTGLQLEEFVEAKSVDTTNPDLYIISRGTDPYQSIRATLLLMQRLQNTPADWEDLWYQLNSPRGWPAGGEEQQQLLYKSWLTETFTRLVEEYSSRPVTIELSDQSIEYTLCDFPLGTKGIDLSRVSALYVGDESNGVGLFDCGTYSLQYGTAQPDNEPLDIEWREMITYNLIPIDIVDRKSLVNPGTGGDVDAPFYANPTLLSVSKLIDPEFRSLPAVLSSTLDCRGTALTLETFWPLFSDQEYVNTAKLRSRTSDSSQTEGNRNQVISSQFRTELPNTLELAACHMTRLLETFDGTEYVTANRSKKGATLFVNLIKTHPWGDTFLAGIAKAAFNISAKKSANFSPEPEIAAQEKVFCRLLCGTLQLGRNQADSGETTIKIALLYTTLKEGGDNSIQNGSGVPPGRVYMEIGQERYLGSLPVLSLATNVTFSSTDSATEKILCTVPLSRIYQSCRYRIDVVVCEKYQDSNETDVDTYPHELASHPTYDPEDSNSNEVERMSDEFSGTNPAQQTQTDRLSSDLANNLILFSGYLSSPSNVGSLKDSLVLSNIYLPLLLNSVKSKKVYVPALTAGIQASSKNEANVQIPDIGYVDPRDGILKQVRSPDDKPFEMNAENFGAFLKLLGWFGSFGEGVFDAKEFPRDAPKKMFASLGYYTLDIQSQGRTIARELFNDRKTLWFWTLVLDRMILQNSLVSALGTDSKDLTLPFDPVRAYITPLLRSTGPVDMPLYFFTKIPHTSKADSFQQLQTMLLYGDNGFTSSKGSFYELYMFQVVDTDSDESQTISYTGSKDSNHPESWVVIGGDSLYAWETPTKPTQKSGAKILVSDSKFVDGLLFQIHTKNPNSELHLFYASSGDHDRWNLERVGCIRAILSLPSKISVLVDSGTDCRLPVALMQEFSNATDSLGRQFLPSVKDLWEACRDFSLTREIAYLQVFYDAGLPEYTALGFENQVSAFLKRLDTVKKWSQNIRKLEPEIKERADRTDPLVSLEKYVSCYKSRINSLSLPTLEDIEADDLQFYNTLIELLVGESVSECPRSPQSVNHLSATFSDPPLLKFLSQPTIPDPATIGSIASYVRGAFGDEMPSQTVPKFGTDQIQRLREIALSVSAQGAPVEILNQFIVSGVDRISRFWFRNDVDSSSPEMFRHSKFHEGHQRAPYVGVCDVPMSLTILASSLDNSNVTSVEHVGGTQFLWSDLFEGIGTSAYIIPFEVFKNQPSEFYEWMELKYFSAAQMNLWRCPRTWQTPLQHGHIYEIPQHPHEPWVLLVVELDTGVLHKVVKVNFRPIESSESFSVSDNTGGGDDDNSNVGDIDTSIQNSDSDDNFFEDDNDYEEPATQFGFGSAQQCDPRLSRKSARIWTNIHIKGPIEEAPFTQTLRDPLEYLKSRHFDATLSEVEFLSPKEYCGVIFRASRLPRAFNKSVFDLLPLFTEDIATMIIGNVCFCSSQSESWFPRTAKTLLAWYERISSDPGKIELSRSNGTIRIGTEFGHSLESPMVYELVNGGVYPVRACMLVTELDKIRVSRSWIDILEEFYPETQFRIVEITLRSLVIAQGGLKCLEEVLLQDYFDTRRFHMDNLSGLEHVEITSSETAAIRKYLLSFPRVLSLADLNTRLSSQQNNSTRFSHWLLNTLIELYPSVDEPESVNFRAHFDGVEWLELWVGEQQHLIKVPREIWAPLKPVDGYCHSIEPLFEWLGIESTLTGIPAFGVSHYEPLTSNPWYNYDSREEDPQSGGNQSDGESYITSDDSDEDEDLLNQKLAHTGIQEPQIVPTNTICGSSPHVVDVQRYSLINLSGDLRNVEDLTGITSRMDYTALEEAQPNSTDSSSVESAYVRNIRDFHVLVNMSNVTSVPYVARMASQYLACDCFLKEDLKEPDLLQTLWAFAWTVALNEFYDKLLLTCRNLGVLESGMSMLEALDLLLTSTVDESHSNTHGIRKPCLELFVCEYYMRDKMSLGSSESLDSFRELSELCDQVVPEILERMFSLDPSKVQTLRERIENILGYPRLTRPVQDVLSLLASSSKTLKCLVRETRNAAELVKSPNSSEPSIASAADISEDDLNAFINNNSHAFAILDCPQDEPVQFTYSTVSLKMLRLFISTADSIPADELVYDFDRLSEWSDYLTAVISSHSKPAEDLLDGFCARIGAEYTGEMLETVDTLLHNYQALLSFLSLFLWSARTEESVLFSAFQLIDLDCSDGVGGKFFPNPSGLMRFIRAINNTLTRKEVVTDRFKPLYKGFSKLLGQRFDIECLRTGSEIAKTAKYSGFSRQLMLGLLNPLKIVLQGEESSQAVTRSKLVSNMVNLLNGLGPVSPVISAIIQVLSPSAISLGVSEMFGSFRTILLQNVFPEFSQCLWRHAILYSQSMIETVCVIPPGIESERKKVLDAMKKRYSGEPKPETTAEFKTIERVGEVYAEMFDRFFRDLSEGSRVESDMAAVQMRMTTDQLLVDRLLVLLWWISPLLDEYLSEPTLKASQVKRLTTEKTGIIFTSRPWPVVRKPTLSGLLARWRLDGSTISNYATTHRDKPTYVKVMAQTLRVIDSGIVLLLDAMYGPLLGHVRGEPLPNVFGLSDIQRQSVVSGLDNCELLLRLHWDYMVEVFRS